MTKDRQLITGVLITAEGFSLKQLDSQDPDVISKLLGCSEVETASLNFNGKEIHLHFDEDALFKTGQCLATYIDGLNHPIPGNFLITGKGMASAPPLNFTSLVKAQNHVLVAA